MVSINEQIMAIIKGSGYSVDEFSEACQLFQESLEKGRRPSTLSEVTTKKDDHVFQVPVAVYPDGPVIGKAIIRVYEAGVCFVHMEFDGEEPTEPRLLHWPMPENFKLATVFVKGKK